jgi:WhiB family redox-sensing transcriptional regulator
MTGHRDKWPSSTAAQALANAVAELADHGQPVPCQSQRRDRWTSEDSHERAWAAAMCHTCPLLAQCADAADEAREKWHVWGGHDRSPRPRRPGRPRGSHANP